MSKGFSKEDVSKMMLSVVGVSVDLYPVSYETDNKFVKMIDSEINESHDLSEDGTLKLEISYNTILKCIDTKYGMSEYMSEFAKSFDVTKGIEFYYDKLVEKYSSPEILILYGLFKNVVYFELTIHLEKDSRPMREKSITTLRLPDISINTVSVKLRDHCSQLMVDELNKYIIRTTGFVNNVMSKRNVFMTETITDLFNLIEGMCQDLENKELYEAFIEALSFLDITEIKDSITLIVTDWPIL